MTPGVRLVICGILESRPWLHRNEYWYVLSAGGDSIAMVYGGMEQLMVWFWRTGGLAGERSMLNTFKIPNFSD